MNITPLEIRQKVFEKAFRGYDKDEVSAFLNSMSIEWERLNDQSKELQYKLKAAEKEAEKLREVETSLFRTLKTAEDTGTNMVEQATKTAELHMKETEMKADGLMNEAKSRAKSIIEDAESRARNIVADMEDEIRELEQVFRSLDANKVSLMGDLKVLANDILDKLNRHQEFPADLKPHTRKAKELIREVNESNTQDEAVNSMLANEDEKSIVQEVEEEQEIEEVVEMADDLEEEQDVVETPEALEEEIEEEQEIQEEEIEEEHEEEKAKTESKGSFFDQLD